MKQETKIQLLVFLGVTSFFLPRLTAADPIVYDSAGRRDPLIPLIGPGNLKAPKSAGDLLVEGIIYDPPAGSLALINGDFYKQGQSVGEASIISIFKDRVVLSQDNEEKTLWIREEVLLKGDNTNADKT